MGSLFKNLQNVGVFAWQTAENCGKWALLREKSPKMTLKNGQGVRGLSGTTPSKPNLSTGARWLVGIQVYPFSSNYKVDQSLLVVNVCGFQEYWDCFFIFYARFLNKHGSLYKKERAQEIVNCFFFVLTV